MKARAETCDVQRLAGEAAERIKASMAEEALAAHDAEINARDLAKKMGAFLVDQEYSNVFGGPGPDSYFDGAWSISWDGPLNLEALAAYVLSEPGWLAARLASDASVVIDLEQLGDPENG